jgi:hypothetical protein
MVEKGILERTLKNLSYVVRSEFALIHHPQDPFLFYCRWDKEVSSILNQDPYPIVNKIKTEEYYITAYFLSRNLTFLSQPIKQIKVLAAHPLVHTQKIQS